MKHTVIKTIVTLLTLSALISSCSKYDEGNASIMTKKNRLCQKWAIQNVRVVWLDGSTILDISHEYTDSFFEFKKDGTLWGIENLKDTDLPLTSDPVITCETKGSWEFSRDKEHLYTDEVITEKIYADGTFLDESIVENRTWRIVKLQPDELKLKQFLPGNSIQYYEYDLIPAE